MLLISTSTLGNYLRVRGEYLLIPTLRPIGRELPPRTRRIHDPNNNAQGFE